MTPRTSQRRAPSVHQLRVRRLRRLRRPRRQGYRPDYVQTSTSNHLLSTRTSRQNPCAARIRASEITTTLGTRAPGITTTLGTRASEITTTLGTRASEITTTLGICATTTHHNARDRSRDHRSNERPTHEDRTEQTERFNRTLLAMLAMFVSQEHDNWDDLLPFMMLAYNTTVHTTTGFTPYRLVFGDECNLPGNLVHRELRPDPPPGDPGSYASWVQQALYESYDEVRAQQQRATHRQKRNYDSKAVARAFPIGCWTLRYYPPARKNKLCSPWIGPYKIVRAPMEWVVGIQVDADARIFYVHMDDLKRCATPDPEPSNDAARGTSIVVSTRAPSTFAPTDIARSQKPPSSTSQQPRSSAHHTDSISSGDTDTVPISTWDLQDAKCILSMKSDCSIDVKGFRFFTMERLFYALQLLSLGDKKFIRQLAKYSRMDYVRKCVNTRFELASTTLQDKWLDEQFQTWTQIITSRILSDPIFKQALLDSARSPLCDPEEPVYATVLTSARKMCVQRKLLCWPTWITLPTRVTRGQVLA